MLEFISSYLDKVIKERVIRAFQHVTNSQEEPITILESLELSPNTNWYIMLLLEKPKEQLTLIIAAITENIPAF